MRRLQSDRAGRRAVIFTGSLASAGLSLLWSCSLMGLTLLDHEVFARTLGVGAVRARYEQSEALTLGELRVLRTSPNVLLACERRIGLRSGGGRTTPVTVIATVPDYFKFHAGRLARGRLLTWQDTASAVPRVVLSAPLAAMVGSPVYVDGERLAIVGTVAPRAGAGEELAVVRLLRSADLAFDCADDADRAISIVADPTAVASTTKRVAAYVDARRGVPPGSSRLVVAASPRESSLWIETHRGTTVILLTATALVAAVAALTIALLLEVRNRGRASELAISRSLGATSRDLAVELILEACALTLIALGLGLLPATGIAWLAAAAVDAPIPIAAIALGTACLLALVMVASAGWATRAALQEPPIRAIGVDQW